MTATARPPGTRARGPRLGPSGPARCRLLARPPPRGRGFGARAPCSAQPMCQPPRAPRRPAAPRPPVLQDLSACSCQTLPAAAEDFGGKTFFVFLEFVVSQSTCSTAALPWRASRAIGPGAPASGVGADAVDTRPPLLGQLVAAWAAERVSRRHTSTRRVVSLATLHRESPPICRCRASRVANAPAPLLAFPPPSPRSARSSRRLPLPSVGPLPIFGESADDVPYEFCFTEI